MTGLTLNDFESLFTGNQDGHGVHEYGQVTDGKKEENGKSYTKNDIVHTGLYENHLSGVKGLGISPIDKHAMCSFGVIDIDVYDKDYSYLVDMIYSNSLPLFPFKSKSSGWHLYMFKSEKVKATQMINTLKGYLVLLGLPKNTEIFPKQGTLKNGGIGNWINLPYYGGEHSKAHLVKPNKTGATLSEALLSIKSHLLNGGDNVDALEMLELADAPPCLQHIYMRKDTSSRNNYLFSLAVYYKAKYGDKFDEYIDQANKELVEPLSSSELFKSVIASHEKKDYSYRCSQDPLCNYCDKQVCKNRKYGIGGDEISELTFEEFIQYQTKPPTYEWMINSKPLKFEDEMEIINQTKFRQLCMRHLHILPGRLKDNNWCKIVNNALTNIVIKAVAIEEDVSTGAIFMEYLAEFLTGKSMATSREELLIDKVYIDTTKGKYVFKIKNLLAFLRTEKQFREYSNTQVQDALKGLDSEAKHYHIGPGTSPIRAWLVPIEAMTGYVEENIKDDFAVDFSTSYEEEAF